MSAGMDSGEGTAKSVVETGERVGDVEGSDEKKESEGEKEEGEEEEESRPGKECSTKQTCFMEYTFLEEMSRTLNVEKLFRYPSKRQGRPLLLNLEV